MYKENPLSAHFSVRKDVCKESIMLVRGFRLVNLLVSPPESTRF
jgi:hypothetical protein